MAELIRNAIRTPDGTVLESRTRHDFKIHDDANGNTYMVDGGLSYHRRSANGDEQDLTVTAEDSFKKQRLAATWGTYGKDGDQPLHYKRVADMEDGHLLAVLRTQPAMYPQIRTLMEQELDHRGVEYDASEIKRECEEVQADHYRGIKALLMMAAERQRD